MLLLAVDLARQVLVVGCQRAGLVVVLSLHVVNLRSPARELSLLVRVGLSVDTGHISLADARSGVVVGIGRRLSHGLLLQHCVCSLLQLPLLLHSVLLRVVLPLLVHLDALLAPATHLFCPLEVDLVLKSTWVANQGREALVVVVVHT